MTVVTAPVRKTLELNCSVEHAFEVFTEQIHTWWPTEEYSISGKHVRNVVFETREGGRIYEVRDDGKEFDWGRVLACEVPARLVFKWFPGSDPATPTEVEVRFIERGGITRFELEHRNWERLGEKAEATRSGYDVGWVEVLGMYETKMQECREYSRIGPRQ